MGDNYGLQLVTGIMRYLLWCAVLWAAGMFLAYHGGAFP